MITTYSYQDPDPGLDGGTKSMKTDCHIEKRSVKWLLDECLVNTLTHTHMLGWLESSYMQVMKLSHIILLARHLLWTLFDVVMRCELNAGCADMLAFSQEHLDWIDMIVSP